MFRRSLGLLRDAWRNRLGRPCLPRFLTYTVTFACNARCVMCDSWRLGRGDELSLDEAARVFSQLPGMDVVRLTGGEPFLRRDLPELVQLVQSVLRPVVLHITSNGLLSEDIRKFCEQRPRTSPLYLLLSIDGLPEKHDRIRGRAGAWDRVWETIRVLAPQAKSWGVRLAVNQTVVDAEGVDQYRRLREVLRPFGIRNHVVVAYDASATYHPQRQLDLRPQQPGEFRTFGEIPREQVRRLLQECEEDLRELTWWERIGKRYYLRGLRHRLLSGQGRPRPPCVALSSHLRILPNGDVPVCQFNSQIVGNLRRQDFAEVWRATAAETQRAWVRRCPGCWAECEVIPNAVYSLDLVRFAAGIDR